MNGWKGKGTPHSEVWVKLFTRYRSRIPAHLTLTLTVAGSEPLLFYRDILK